MPYHIRYLDKNTAALLMLKASTRWLAVRGDILINFFFVAVPTGALLTMQSPGYALLSLNEGYHPF